MGRLKMFSYNRYIIGIDQVMVADPVEFDPDLAPILNKNWVQPSKKKRTWIQPNFDLIFFLFDIKVNLIDTKRIDQGTHSVVSGIR